jgi:hypothetical protein
VDIQGNTRRIEGLHQYSTVSELKLFCTYLEKAAEQQGLDTSDYLPQNVGRMFQA